MAKRILRTIRSETVELVRISVTKDDENPYLDRGSQERGVRPVRDGEHIELTNETHPSAHREEQQIAEMNDFD
jgi:hypothetical protein